MPSRPQVRMFAPPHCPFPVACDLKIVNNLQIVYGIESEIRREQGKFSMGNPIAVAYFRTSSAANVGTDKDSEARQRDAVTAYARSAKLEVVAECYDAAVSGAPASFACSTIAPPTMGQKSGGYNA